MVTRAACGQVQEQRVRYETAALVYAERTAEVRRKEREAEQARREEQEELSVGAARTMSPQLVAHV